jgi:hypothetical protein
MTPDHWLVSQYDHAQPDPQPDGSFIYEANPHGRGPVYYVNGPVPHFTPGEIGFSVPIEPVGVPPPIVNDSFGA